MVSESVSDYLSRIGRRGGRKNTARKRAAILKNLIAAAKKRWPNGKKRLDKCKNGHHSDQ